MIIVGIFVAIIIFTIVVLVHELGHFFAARKFGVRVEEFGLGLPPKAKSLFIDKKGTLFTLNWLPLGGFVKLTGENVNTFQVYDENKKIYNNLNLEKDIKAGKDIFDKNGKKLLNVEKEEILKKLEENNASYNLSKKPAWQQAIIMLAGVFMNFLLAFFIFFVLFLVGLKPIGINNKIDTNLELKLVPTYEQAIEAGILIKYPGLILNPVEGSVAEESGLRTGDVLYQIEICKSQVWDGPVCKDGEGSNFYVINKVTDLTDLLQENIGKLVTFWVNSTFDENGDIRGGSVLGIKIPESGKIGTYLGENIDVNKDFVYKYGVLDSIKYAFLETKNEALLTLKGLSYLIGKIFNPENKEEREEALKSVSGPIGIVGFISESLKSGIMFLIVFGAIISINLGIFNLLPIPALDGGRFLFIFVNGVMEKLFGKKIIGSISEAIIHFLFFILLIALSVIIAYNDVNKIINN